DDTILCDLIAGTIKYLKAGESVNVSAERNKFQMAEIMHFFDIVEGRIENDSNVEHGIQVLKLTKSII
ncbi:MAG: hypothetical protein UH071_07685, partial [Paludibacteraceae bacterium]|nr:hypothetical protein [Paludibacteraceae bacterium]